MNRQCMGKKRHESVCCSLSGSISRWKRESLVHLVQRSVRLGDPQRKREEDRGEQMICGVKLEFLFLEHVTDVRFLHTRHTHATTPSLTDCRHEPALLTILCPTFLLQYIERKRRRRSIQQLGKHTQAGTKREIRHQFSRSSLEKKKERHTECTQRGKLFTESSSSSSFFLLFHCLLVSCSQSVGTQAIFSHSSRKNTEIDICRDEEMHTQMKRQMRPSHETEGKKEIPLVHEFEQRAQCTAANLFDL